MKLPLHANKARYFLRMRCLGNQFSSFALIDTASSLSHLVVLVNPGSSAVLTVFCLGNVSTLYSPAQPLQISLKTFEEF